MNHDPSAESQALGLVLFIATAVAYVWIGDLIRAIKNRKNKR